MLALPFSVLSFLRAFPVVPAGARILRGLFSFSEAGEALGSTSFFFRGLRCLAGALSWRVADDCAAPDLRFAAAEDEGGPSPSRETTIVFECADSGRVKNGPSISLLGALDKSLLELLSKASMFGPPLPPPPPQNCTQLDKVLSFDMNRPAHPPSKNGCADVLR